MYIPRMDIMKGWLFFDEETYQNTIGSLVK